MKKRILTLALVVILIATIFCLTGCANNEESENIEEGLSESNVLEKTSQTEGKEEIAISSIVEKFNEGVAIVQGEDNLWYAIDEEGNVLVDLKEDMGDDYYVNEDIVSVSNGYIVYSSHNSSASYGKIWDSKGNTVKEYKSDSETIYYINGISESGYVSLEIASEDITGTTKTYAIMDLDDNVIVSYEYSSEDKRVVIESIFDDVFRISDGNAEDDETIYLNAKTNQKLNFDYGLKSDVIKLSDTWYYTYVDSSPQNGGTYVSTDGQTFEDTFGSGIFLDKYYWNGDDEAIKNIDGTVAKDLSDNGGINQLFECDGVIYVITDTSYIYTMDSDFNTIAEPVKKDDIYMIRTDYGIYTNTNDGTLIDENLNEVSTISSDEKLFNTTRSNIKMDYYSNSCIYGSNIIWSAKTNELLKIYK